MAASSSYIVDEGLFLGNEVPFRSCRWASASARSNRSTSALRVRGTVDPLARTAVELPAPAFGVASGHERRLILEVKDQPEFETGVGHREVDAVLDRQPDGRESFQGT